MVIGHVAGGTQTIRVGSGGVMLPNHAPLVIAEQFGTLASLYPGRIDLGLGRAPGTDQTTARALRRDLQGSADTFPDDVRRAAALLRRPGARPARARGAGRGPEGADLAARLVALQRAARGGARAAVRVRVALRARPSADRRCGSTARSSGRRRTLDKPYAMVGVNRVRRRYGPEGAELLFTSLQQQFVNLRRGTPGQLPPPVDTTSVERAEMELTRRRAFARVLGDRRPATRCAPGLHR